MLRGGERITLEWAAGDSRPTEHPAEEWEAFLSVDGGRTWAYRITPHLDLDLRRIIWRVPNVPTSDARLLLRFGDETNELAVALPQRFSIALPAAPLPDISWPRPGRGEPALDGKSGVVSWVDGTRRGGGERRFATLPSRIWPDGPAECRSAPREPRPAVLPAGLQAPGQRSPGQGAPKPPASHLPSAIARGTTASDILLRTHRRNV